MPEARGACPGAHWLEDFRASRLVGRTARRVAEHVETCAACRAELAELSLDDRFVGDLHDLLPGGPDLDIPAERRPPRLQGFRITGEVGHGGMGVVWEARDTELGRPVAVKVLHEKLAGNETALRRFVTEARITGQLQHPGIVPVYRLGVAGDGRPFLSMKLVRGRTLAQILAEGEASNGRPLELLSIFQRICEAVSYAHSRGVIHRDLKPSNVMVGPFGEVQVLDWGLAKVLDEEDTDPDASVITPVSPDSPASPASVTGSVVGTPSYMSPEQASGHVETLSQRSDVFSLGTILCEILTGHRPSSRKERGACWHLEECGADRGLVELTRACLAADPDERPADAGHVARAVASYLASVDRRAREAELEAAAARARADQEHRARRRTAVLGSALLIALGSASFASWRTWRGRTLAAEGTATTLANARSLFDQGDYGNAAEVARSTLDQAVWLGGDNEAELQSLVKNGSLMSRLHESRPLGPGGYDEGICRTIRAEFREGFREHGLEVLGMGTAEAASYLEDAGLQGRVRPFLDVWAQTECYLEGWSSVDGRRLLELASALDGNATRQELRETVVDTRDGEELLPFLELERARQLDPSTLTMLIGALANRYREPELRGLAYEIRGAILMVREYYPSDIDVLAALGLACWYVGALEQELAGGAMTREARFAINEAIEHLGGVCVLEPDDPIPRAWLGMCYESLGDSARGAASFSEAVQGMRIDRARSNHLFSIMMEGFDATDLVIERLEVLVAEHPDAAELWSELAWNLCHQRPPEAQRALEAAWRAFEIEPDARARETLGIAQYFSGELDECARTLEALSDEDENSYPGLIRAICLHELGHEEDARRLGRRMLKRMETVTDRYTEQVHRRGAELFGR